MGKYTEEKYIRKIASHYKSSMIFAEDENGTCNYLQGEGPNLTAHLVQAMNEQEGFVALILSALIVAREQNENIKEYLDACARAFLIDNPSKTKTEIPYSEEEDED